MSYEPTNWKAGDTVTSTKLNKMEQGINNLQNMVFYATFQENAEQNIAKLGNPPTIWNDYITLQENMPSLNELLAARSNGILPYITLTGDDMFREVIFTYQVSYNNGDVVTLWFTSILAQNLSVSILLFSTNPNEPLTIEPPFHQSN